MEIIMADDQVVTVSKGKKDAPLLKTSLVESLKDDPIRTVRALVTICERAMQPQVIKWERYSRKYRRGLRYVLQDSATNPLYSTNYIFNVVETLKSNLTGSLPALTMQPVEDGDDIAADIFTKILRQSLKRASMKDHTERVVQHGAIAGAGWYKVWFNEDAFYGKGDNEIETIAPEDMLVLPTMLDYRISDLFIHRIRDLTESQIKAMFDVEKVDGAPERTLVENDRSTGDVDRKTPGIKTFNVYEAWLKDHESGKWYICTIAGNTVLREPEVSPYKHGRAPFVPWYDNYDVRADQAYTLGSGEVEEIEPLQDQADAMDMRIYKNIKQVTSRQRVINPASGISREDIDDTPNRVYLVTGRPQDAMLWDNPPQLSQEVYMYRERIEDRIQIVSGFFEVTQGKKPSGIQAARAVSALQSAGSKRIEKKSELLIRAQEDVGSLAAQNILQFYEGERIIRASSKLLKIIDDYPDTFAMEGEDEQRLEDLKAMWKQQNGIDLVLSDVKFNFDIVASTDSALPDDKADRVQLAADLFRLGAIDRQALLEAVDYPDRNEILKRLSGNVTGKTPAEAMPENQAGVAQAQATQAQIQGQQQQQTQAQQGRIDQVLQSQQEMAQQLQNAYGAMRPMPEIPIK